MSLRTTTPAKRMTSLSSGKDESSLEHISNYLNLLLFLVSCRRKLLTSKNPRETRRRNNRITSEGILFLPLLLLSLMHFFFSFHQLQNQSYSLVDVFKCRARHYSFGPYHFRLDLSGFAHTNQLIIQPLLEIHLLLCTDHIFYSIYWFNYLSALDFGVRLIRVFI